MPVKKRKTKSTKVQPRKINLRDEVTALQYVLDAKRSEEFSKGELAQRCLLLERDYADLRSRLVNLLLPEQIDAARICGVTPEVYALEWIDLLKDRLRTYAPGYFYPVQNLKELKYNPQGI